MPLKITQDCVNCTACADVCPNGGIRPGRSAYVIDQARCTECVGIFAVEQCVAVCPVDCIVRADGARTAKSEPGWWERVFGRAVRPAGGNG